MHGIVRRTMVVAAGLAAVAAGVAAPATAGVAAPAAAGASAGKYYQSCYELNKRYPAGVASSAATARWWVRQGYSRPATSKRAVKVYWKNHSNLDRNGDGVACES